MSSPVATSPETCRLRAEHAFHVIAPVLLLVINKLSASEQNPGRDSKTHIWKKNGRL